MRLTDRIYCGGEPADAKAFAELADLGIKTIVSVDGAIPNVTEARNHGLGYVHIPIGYEGVPKRAAWSLTRLVREMEGPIYFHCHHGKHRGPAAAAVACIAEGDTTSLGALEILRRGGTSTNYSGLWRDVAAFSPPGPDAPLPELEEIARVNSLATAMADLDRVFDQLTGCQEAGWETPSSHPDLAPSQVALLIKEAFHELNRAHSSGRDERFKQWLSDAEAGAGRLEDELRARTKHEATDTFHRLEASCVRCHQAYRDQGR